jgi:hypothetical protein
LKVFLWENIGKDLGLSQEPDLLGNFQVWNRGWQLKIYEKWRSLARE